MLIDQPWHEMVKSFQKCTCCGADGDTVRRAALDKISRDTFAAIIGRYFCASRRIDVRGHVDAQKYAGIVAPNAHLYNLPQRMLAEKKAP